MLLVLAFYLTYHHTIWMPREGRLPEAFTLLPVPDTVWHSVGWLCFVALLLALFVTSVRPVPPDDLAVRRIAIAALALTYALTALLRVTTGRTFGLGPGALVALAVAAAAAAAVLLRWPPPTRWLLGLTLVGGVAVRLALQVLIPPDPAFADNLPVIELSLGRLLGGMTPYAVHDLGSHTQTMPYLPFTFLAYLPAYALGLDIRTTNVVLASAVTLVCWRVASSLPLAPAMRSALALAAGVLFVLPVRISHDLFTAWPLFNLLLTLTFALMLVARIRLAAVAYGASLATMPVAAFVAPPLFLLALRTRPLREVAVLAAIVAAVGGLPTLLFVLWDAQAFSRAVGYGTTGLWGALASGQSTLPLLLWHGWLGAWLLAVQALLVAAVAVLAWTRLGTVRGLIALSALLYVGLVITGPHIAQYMTAIVLYLALLEEGARASGVTAGDRALGLAGETSSATARADMIRAHA